MRSLLPDYDLCLKGLDRSAGDNVGPFASGSGIVTFRPVPTGLIWSLDQVMISGRTAAGVNGIGGARVNLHRNSVSDDTYFGTVLLGGSDPAAIFDTPDGCTPWLLGGERLVIDVQGATAGVICVARADYHLWELRPVKQLRPAGGDPGSFAKPMQGDGDTAADAPDPSDLLDRDPLTPGQGPQADRHPLDGSPYPTQYDPAVPAPVPFPDGRPVTGGDF